MSSYPNATSEAPKRLGRYELIGQLATGGMAEIHLARLAGEGGFEKIVVVKRLLPELVASPAYVAMFLDEGKLVARLDHPNICEVYELGRDGAEYYLAMPYLDGIAVHELIARPRDPDRIAQLRVATGVIVQACAGLHHAHELRDADGQPAGLVHRDVSPSNLFVTSAGVVKVLDFGVAKVRGGTETEVGTIKGKQQYMAPEQLLGEPLDRRCDVFALGIVLYELATHQRLFKRASDYLTAKAVLEEATPRADAVDPAVPRALADVIAKALARAPKHRYATAAELAAAIEAAMAAHGGIASASAIAAAVNATDELSAMRTRQARVLGEAKSRVVDAGVRAVAADEPDTKVDVAPTTPLRGPRARRRMMPVVMAGLGVAIAMIVVAAAMRGSSVRDEDVAAAGRDAGGASVVATGDVGTTGREQDGTVDETAGGDARRPSAMGDAGAASVAVAAGDAGAVAVGVARDAAVATVDVGRDAAVAGIDLARDAATARDRTKPAAKPGLLSIDSTPWATIYVDGASLGVTPIVKRSLPAGRHKLRAVLKDGRAKELAIDIPAGKLAKPIQLTW